VRARNKGSRRGRGRPEHEVNGVSSRRNGFARAAKEEEVTVIKAVGDTEGMHARLRVKDARARWQDPDVRDVEGVGSAVVAEDGEHSITNSVGMSGAVGGSNGAGGIGRMNGREVCGIRDNKVGGLGVNESKDIESKGSRICRGQRRGKDEGRGTGHEGTRRKGSNEIVDVT